MKISHDGKQVMFKTEPEELFETEKSGAKSNTIRILDIDEYHQLRKCNPEKIVVQYKQEIFRRTITNLHVTEGVYGKVIVVISWANSDNKSRKITSIPIAKTMRCPDCDGDLLKSRAGELGECAICHALFYLDLGIENKLDELAPILLPRTLIFDLGRHRQGGSHAEFIRELFEMYLDTLREGTMHD